MAAVCRSKDGQGYDQGLEGMEKGARIDPIALNNMERLSEPN
jgi:hypothetical protein